MPGPDFSALLSKPVSEIKKPKPLPEGSFELIITNYKYEEANTPNDTANPKKPVCNLALRYNQAMEDVDQADLNDALQGEALTSKTTNYTLWLTPDAQYRAVELCQTCGIQTEGMTLGQMIPELVNKTVIGNVVQVASKRAGAKPDDKFANLASIVGPVDISGLQQQ